MIIHHNILAMLRTFLNLKKKIKNNQKLYNKQTSTAVTTEFLSQIPKRKKMSNEQFNLCEAETFLDVSLNL